MKTILVLGLLLTACVARTPDVSVDTLPDIPLVSNVQPPVPTPYPTLEPTATFKPAIERTNWLLLGGDYRAHREGTGWGNKTDVIVLVSVLETDPMQITVVQFPRNLYAPFSYGDVWLFGVWDAYGWQGLHQYFQEVFGVSLQGIHYINMDGFVQIVDEFGMDGEKTLAYLRDNENNWERGSYDAEQRVFNVLVDLWGFGRAYFLDDPIVATNAVYSRWGDLFESDLGNIEQLYWLFRLGWRVRNAEWDWQMVQLERPVIIRGDTPIVQNELPMRGMVADTDLKVWMSEVLDG